MGHEKKEDEAPKIKKGFWGQIWPYAKEYRNNIIITVVCSVIVGICVALQPLMIKFIVDDGIAGDIADSLDKLKYVGFICILFILLGLIRISFWRVAVQNLQNVLEGSLFHLRSHFFSHVENMCMRFYDKTSTGEIFNCIMGTPMNNIKNFMNQMLISMPYQVVSLVISLSALIYYDWILTLILFVTAAVMAFLNYRSREKIRNVSAEYMNSETEASKYISDVLNGMDSVRLYSVEENVFSTFQSFINNMYKKGVKASVSQMREALKPEFIQYVGTAVVYFVGAVSCIYRDVSVGVLYAFLSSMGNILGILTSWLTIGLQKSMAEAAMDKIFTVMNTNTSTPEPEDNRVRSVEYERKRAQRKEMPCIEFQDVQFGYDSQKIFDEFNCSVRYNESIALVGGSGSGKSTFSKLVMRLYDVDQGTVKLHGRDVRDYNLHDLRTSFGIVPQNPFIFQGTIWDNIRLARPDSANEDIIKAMEIAHVHEFVNGLPDGWNTVVGDGGLELSGGQKQRIAIARATLGNPDILIFDEATSALDNISEKLIQEAMEELMKSHTVIIIAHRLSTIRNVDRIFVFNKGKIVEEGSFDELARMDGTFAELLTFGN